jgi:hypothetical protein
MTETDASASFPAEVQLDMFGPPRVQGREAHSGSTPAELDGVQTMPPAAGLSDDEARQLRLELETQLARLEEAV